MLFDEQDINRSINNIWGLFRSFFCFDLWYLEYFFYMNYSSLCAFSLWIGMYMLRLVVIGDYMVLISNSKLDHKASNVLCIITF
jgi:hypothetical protein